MSGGLKMPKRGEAAALLSELNAEHAPVPLDNPEDEPSVTNVTTLQRTSERTKKRVNEDANVSSKQRSNAETKERFTVTSNERDDRLNKALQMAADDEINVVTIRVSTRLNEYMDRYVERVNRVNPKRRYRKQDAVAEAFAAFFADHPLPPAPADEEL